MTRAAVIGHPVAHSKSPRIHGFWLQQLGIEGRYDRLDISPEALADFMTKLPTSGLAGVNVTLPHKINAVPYMTVLTPLARQVGAVNTVVVQRDGNLLGHNSDVGGFALPLSKIADFTGQKAVLLGAGGAARAIVAGLAGLGFAEIHVINRSADKINALRDIAPVVAHDWPTASIALQGASLLVNSTSLGMAGQPSLDIDLSPLLPEAIVNDIVYAPLETPLLAQAKARGHRCIDGLEMLIGQAAEAFALFFGQAPNRAEDQRLRGLLVS